MKPSAAFALAILLSSPAAVAQNNPVPPQKPRAAQQGPCLGDFDRFCSAVPAGGGRKIACLEDHRTQLTPVCRARLDIIISIEQSQAAKNHESLAEWRQKIYAMHEHADYVRKLNVQRQQQNAGAAQTPAPGAPNTPAAPATPNQTTPQK